MEDTFVLKIQLGNEAMQSKSHIAAALRELAFDLENLDRERFGIVRDENGNTVGQWEIQ